MILDVQLADQRSAWDMQPDGSYIQRVPKDETSKGSQETLIGVADRRLAAASKHKEKNFRSRLVNHFHRRVKQKDDQV